MSNLFEQDSIPTMELLQEDSHAKTSVWLESVLDYLGNEVDSSLRLPDSLTKPKRNTSSSKMSLDYYQVMAGQTWRSSSKRWSNSGIVCRGELLTLNTLESPKDVRESSLSEVLEMTGEHLRKYFLSAKAAEGILRRASKRGKQLPEKLQKALEMVI